MMPCHRSGLTLIELAVVVSIVVALSLAAVPGLTAIARRAAVNQGVTRLHAVIAEAQRLSRRVTPTAQVLAATNHYGVAIITDEGAPYATILHGQDDDDELLDADGRPVHRAALPGSLEVAWSPASAKLSWFFQYGSGKPIQSPADQKPVDIGTTARAASGLDRTGTSWNSYKLYAPAIPAIPASPVTEYLRLRHRSGNVAVALAIYSTGLIAIADAP